MRWKKWHTFFHAAMFFFENVFGSCRWCQVFASSMFSVTSAPFSQYIHHSCITNGFMKSLAGGITFQKLVAETYENQWLSTGHCWVFGQLCIAFWSGEISFSKMALNLWNLDPIFALDFFYDFFIWCIAQFIWFITRSLLNHKNCAIYFDPSETRWNWTVLKLAARIVRLLKGCMLMTCRERWRLKSALTTGTFAPA